MKVVDQVDYRGCTLLRFEQRVLHDGDPRVHWMVIARDGINILGSLIPTDAAARALVDRTLGPDPDAPPPQARLRRTGLTVSSN